VDSSPQTVQRIITTVKSIGTSGFAVNPDGT